jgi:hypothetical protein
VITQLAGAVFLRRIVSDIVNRLTGRIAAGSARGQPLQNNIARHFQIGDKIHLDIEFGQQFLQFFRLWNRPRKTIQNKSLPAIRFLQPCFHNVHNQRIRHEISPIHVFFCFLPKGIPFLDGRSQNVAGGYLYGSVKFFKQLGYRALAGSRCA